MTVCRNTWPLCSRFRWAVLVQREPLGRFLYLFMGPWFASVRLAG